MKPPLDCPSSYEIIALSRMRAGKAFIQNENVQYVVLNIFELQKETFLGNTTVYGKWNMIIYMNLNSIKLFNALISL